VPKISSGKRSGCRRFGVRVFEIQDLLVRPEFGHGFSI
jgi:hypothetical protein